MGLLGVLGGVCPGRDLLVDKNLLELTLWGLLRKVIHFSLLLFWMLLIFVFKVLMLE